MEDLAQQVLFIPKNIHFSKGEVLRRLGFPSKQRGRNHNGGSKKANLASPRCSFLKRG